MSSILDSTEHLEQELAPEPIVAPAMGAIALHLALAGAVVAWGIVGGFFHHSVWGSPGVGGAIQVNLVSSALPLPADQPPTDNVLATETPSRAPAQPEPKAKEKVDTDAIAIQGKQKKPQAATTPKAPPKPPQPKQDNKAQYGEQAGSTIPRQTLPQPGSNGPVSVNSGDFGTRFPWFVDGMNRKMQTTWYRQEVDPRTPKGTRVYLIFTIKKDGSPVNPQVDRSSGSSTLDRSCLRAVQRVDTFGNLPSGYNGSSISVSYYCEY
ncbi:MAG: TonB family protein [Terracidiphilus sp.]